MHLKHGGGEEWTDRITKGGFSEDEKERLLLKILKNIRHSWRGHITGC
jgi:hypothetical protein